MSRDAAGARDTAEQAAGLSARLGELAGCAAGSAEAREAEETLERLEALPVTTEVLTASKAGVRVNKLRKHADPAVAARARELVRRWKALVASPGKRKKPAAVSVADAAPAAGGGGGGQEKPGTPKAKTYAGGHGSFKLGLRDATRDKVQRMLHDALAEPDPDSKRPEVCGRVEAAVRIESAMFAKYRNVAQGYKAKFRALAPNLRSKDNRELSWQLYDGHLTPERLVELEAADLASGAVKKQREKAAKDAIEAARCDWGADRGATEMFKCGKCKKRKCTYYQLQTRSADEPMTTFITCLACGNKWRE